jgi:hypothetical protein
MAHHVKDVTLSTENYTTPGDATSSFLLDREAGIHAVSRLVGSALDPSGSLSILFSCGHFVGTASRPDYAHRSHRGPEAGRAAHEDIIAIPKGRCAPPPPSSVIAHRQEGFVSSQRDLTWSLRKCFDNSLSSRELNRLLSYRTGPPFGQMVSRCKRMRVA